MESITEELLEWVGRYGYAAIVLLLVLGIIGLPAPEETLLAFSGYLASRGDLVLLPAIASGIVGSLLGITSSFLLGLTVGRWLVRKAGRYVGITPARMERAHDWYRRYGRWALTFGYFVPGVRHLTAFVAGTTRLEYPVFALYAYPGGILWSTAYTLLGFYLGKEWSEMTGEARRIILIVAGIVFGVILLGVVLHVGWIWLRRSRQSTVDSRRHGRTDGGRPGRP